MHTIWFGNPGDVDMTGADISGWRAVFVRSDSNLFVVAPQSPSAAFADAASAAAYVSYLNGGAVAPGP